MCRQVSRGARVPVLSHTIPHTHTHAQCPARNEKERKLVRYLCVALSLTDKFRRGGRTRPATTTSFVRAPPSYEPPAPDRIYARRYSAPSRAEPRPRRSFVHECTRRCTRVSPCRHAPTRICSSRACTRGSEPRNIYPGKLFPRARYVRAKSQSSLMKCALDGRGRLPK